MTFECKPYVKSDTCEEIVFSTGYIQHIVCTKRQASTVRQYVLASYVRHIAPETVSADGNRFIDIVV